MQPKHRELVPALAGETGLSNTMLRTMLGPDENTLKPPASLLQAITCTHREIGKAPDGGEYIVYTYNSQYVLTAPAWLDWHEFRDEHKAWRECLHATAGIAADDEPHEDAKALHAQITRRRLVHSGRP